MTRKVKNFKFQNNITLYGLTDAHIGAVSHDKDTFQNVISKIKKDKDAYCFFNGDNIELIPPGYGILESGQDLSVDEQVDELVNLINDLGSKVLFIRAGNHENRAANLLGYDLAGRISKETNVHLLHTGMEEVQVWMGRKKYRIVTSHGEGGGSKRLLLNMQLTFPGADIYFTGHTHEKFYNAGNMTIDTSSGKEEFRTQIECVGGSFLKWADYARGKNMRPTTTGCFKFAIRNDSIMVSEG